MAKFLREYSAVRPANLAAALAFRAVLSLFPLAVLILVIYDYVGQPYLSRGSVLSAIAVLFPYVPNEEVEKVLRGVGLNFGWWGMAGALGLAWSSSFFFGSLEAAFNRIYNSKNRAFVAGRLMFTLMSVVFSVLLLLMAAASVLLPTIKSVLTFFLGWWPLGGVAFWAGLVAANLLFGLIYWVVPNTRLDMRQVWLGTTVASALFQGISYGFGLYLHFARFYRYGVFAISLVLLLWFYFLSEIILFGAYLNFYFLGDKSKRGSFRRLRW